MYTYVYISLQKYIYAHVHIHRNIYVHIYIYTPPHTHTHFFPNYNHLLHMENDEEECPSPKEVMIRYSYMVLGAEFIINKVHRPENL